MHKLSIVLLVLPGIFADEHNSTSMTFFEHLTQELTPFFNVTYNDTILAKSLQGNPAMLRNINPYGCWCNFDNMPNFLGGDPVDEIDHACKILQESYRCVQIDDDNGIQNCDIYTTQYIPSTSFYSTFKSTQEQVIDNISNDCSRKNGPSGCAYNLCTIEGFFLTKMLGLLTSSGKWSYQHKHTSPLWAAIKEEKCAPEVNIETSDDYFFDQTGRFDMNTDSNFGAFDDFEKDPYEEELIESIKIIEGEDVEEEIEEELMYTQIGDKSLTKPNMPSDVASPRPLTAIKSQIKKKKPASSIKKELELLDLKVISKDECCGTYPLRLPFNKGITHSSLEPAKECCANRFIYNTSFNECCFGKVTSVGTC